MGGLRQRKPPHRSKEFLAWAKTQHARCCLCNDKDGCHLHHLDPGLGTTGSDLLVARLCVECHQWAEGKRRIALERMGKVDKWADMIDDALWLLSRWTEMLGNK